MGPIAMPTLYTALKARSLRGSVKGFYQGAVGPLARIVLKPGQPAVSIPAARVPHAKHISLTDRFKIRPVKRKPPHILVIGAGFAGLAAAYELKTIGYKVTVLEAQKRIGGRVRSLKKWIGNKTVEGGGELIGLNHAAWRSYASNLNCHSWNCLTTTPTIRYSSRVNCWLFPRRRPTPYC
jgi:NADPH-dependent 2,4-dienoyl-CoA reductase/sulfur reductase-like enzyme